MNYRPDIDGLRAVAILYVMLYHAFPETFDSGFVGVDIFFVISGFLISSIIFQGLEKGTFTYTDFYVRRIKRIFPSLILVLVTGLVFGWFFQRPDEFSQLGKHIAAGGGFITNFVLWGESGYFDSGVETKPLLHLWSLAIEEQFYIIWPILVAFAFRKKWNLLKLTLGIGLVSFAINLYLSFTDETTAFYWPISRFWELMIGCVLAYTVMHKPKVFDRHKKWLPVVGTILIVYSLSNIHEGEFPGWQALIPTLGAVCVIASNGTWLTRLLSNRVLVFIGLISYPLYLWHWPVQHALSKSFESDIAGLLTIGISFILAWLTYELIEKPIRFGVKRPVMVLGTTAVAIVMAGCTVTMTNGLDYRFPKDLRFAYRSSIEQDIHAEWRLKQCYLSEVKGPEDFSECIDGRKDLVFLWGDSHAAALYPGLKHLQETNGFSIAQYTSSACPPLAGWDDPKLVLCRRKNDFILGLIEKTHPETVILHADWMRSDKTKFGSPYNISMVENTVRELKRIGIPNIVIVGPVPQWKRGLPTLLWDCRKEDSDYLVGSDLSKCGLETTVAEVDESMGKLSQRLDVKYVSAYRTFCGDNGCLVKTEGTLTTFDNGHLSPAAAQYLTSTFLSTLGTSPSLQGFVPNNQKTLHASITQ